MTEWIDLDDGGMVNAQHVMLVRRLSSPKGEDPRFGLYNQTRDLIGTVSDLPKHREYIPAPAGWYVAIAWPLAEKPEVTLNPILVWHVKEDGLYAVTIEGVFSPVEWMYLGGDTIVDGVVGLRDPDGTFWVVGDSESAEMIVGDAALLDYARRILEARAEQRQAKADGSPPEGHR